MTTIDWILVLTLNGAIILYGFYLRRQVHSSPEWFWAGRKLP